MKQRRQKRRVNDNRNIGAFAKITPPIPSQVHPRIRVFRLIDNARKQPIVWISAPAGAGKTTLIASYLQARKLPAVWYHVDSGDRDIASFFYYMAVAAKRSAPRYRKALPFLTPEYFGDLLAFSSHFFRELFLRFKRHHVLVFDNYQDVPADSRLHELVAQGFAQVPSGITAIVLSREAPPDAFVRARASGHMTLLDFDDVKFTLEESAEVLKLRKKGKPLSAQDAARLHEETQGWVAGLVLLSENAPREVLARPHPSTSADTSVFDYFASEVFRHAGAPTQDFLLKTAFLPKFPIAVAQALAGVTNAASILDYLARRNLFTVQHADGSYEYHALFRAFLSMRARTTHSPEEIRALKRRSAQCLAENGDIENAVSLLQEIEDWEASLRLITSRASMFLKQGRAQTIEAWLRGVPENVWQGNAWALYWFGMCRMSFAPAEARRYFENAFTLFEKSSDSSPLYLAWSGIMESLALERDDFTQVHRWLDTYKFLTIGRAAPTPEIEAASIFTYLTGLISSRFDDPDLATYVERAELLLKHDNENDRSLAQALILVSYNLWKGEIAKTKRLLDSLAPLIHASESRPLTRLQWYLWQVLCTGGIGEPEASTKAVSDFLALADASGVHLLDLQLLGYGIWGQLCAGNISGARVLLDRMSSLPRAGLVKESFYNHFSSMVFLQEGNISRAVEDARSAAELSQRCGLSLGEVSYRIGLAYAYACQGDLAAASAAVAEARPKALRMRSKLLVTQMSFCEADIHRLRGEQEQSLRALRDALSLAESIGVFTAAYCPREHAAALYLTALDNDIHSDYVRTTIVKTRLSPPPGLPERWPWSVRLYTLGRFVITKEDKPIIFDGRAQQKPMQLLRAVAAFGGRNVSAAKLAQALWPETEGDMAEHSVETTLHRLRRLVGEECIVRQGHQLSLNPNYCWFDSWAIEQMFDDDPSMASLERTTQLLRLYKGTFLPDEDAPWAVAQRERLHSKFLRALLDRGRSLETADQWLDAATLYQQLIEIDPVSEESYIRLMQCYRRLNRAAEALATYQRCERALKSLLHVEPSAPLRQLRAEIQRVG